MTADGLAPIREPHPDTRTLAAFTGDIMAANPKGDTLARIQQNIAFTRLHMETYAFKSG
ncbi:hypothetical protein [Methanoculleus frigidifontis]|uniref:hypothetical protein n=1 Tax=Methanoculleus frigidifontis TaxID=2584085 RepID=UPI00265835A9|nr:hypothetical protein [Methanoculleus sp. FWC-SCC1]